MNPAQYSITNMISWSDARAKWIRIGKETVDGSIGPGELCVNVKITRNIKRYRLVSWMR